MKNTFKSKIDKVYAIPLVLILSIGEFLLIRNHFWFGAVLGAIVIVFALYLWIDTFYQLTPEKLRIRSGFLYQKEIYVKSIKKIRRTRNHFASPAFSPDRLEISFNRYERVMISPEEGKEFIRQLTSVNPRITIDKN